MMELSDVVLTETSSVCCNGEHIGGHPLVYLEMGEHGEITCPYCSRHFVLREEATLTH
jgi:uncharacterized Zn-finger protein